MFAKICHAVGYFTVANAYAWHFPGYAYALSAVYFLLAIASVKEIFDKDHDKKDQ